VLCSLQPVATTTPAGLPVWGPRFAPGSVFVVPRLLAFAYSGARALDDWCVAAGWSRSLQHDLKLTPIAKSLATWVDEYGTGSGSDRVLAIKLDFTRSD